MLEESGRRLCAGALLDAAVGRRQGLQAGDLEVGATFPARALPNMRKMAIYAECQPYYGEAATLPGRGLEDAEPYRVN